MHRCAPAALAVVAALAVALPAWAQMKRHFPANALRGDAVFQPAPAITLNGQAARMAPGGRIYNMRNLIATPSSLVGTQAEVHYTIDPHGKVREVWILTDEERAIQPWPRTPQEAAGWVFNPTAQTWSKR